MIQVAGACYLRQAQQIDTRRTSHSTTTITPGIRKSVATLNPIFRSLVFLDRESDVRPSTLQIDV